MNIFLLSVISIIFIIIAIIYLVVETEIYNKTPLRSLKDRRLRDATQIYNIAIAISVIGLFIALPLTVLAFFNSGKHHEPRGVTVALWLLYIISLLTLFISVAVWLEYTLPYIRTVDTLLKAAIVASLINFILVSLPLL